MYKFYIDHDPEPQSPREWDNVGTIVASHPRYDLGDEHWRPSEVCHLKEAVIQYIYEVEQDEIELEHYNRLQKEYVWLPLTIYDHGGISLSVGEGSGWDSMVVGFIYAQITNEHSKDELIKRLESEIEVYDQYLRGDIYGFQLAKEKKCDCCGHIEADEIESCWGFYGSDWKENGMKDHLSPEIIAQIEAGIIPVIEKYLNV